MPFLMGAQIRFNKECLCHAGVPAAPGTEKYQLPRHPKFQRPRRRPPSSLVWHCDAVLVCVVRGGSASLHFARGEEKAFSRFALRGVFAQRFVLILPIAP